MLLNKNKNNIINQRKSAKTTPPEKMSVKRYD